MPKPKQINNSNETSGPVFRRYFDWAATAIPDTDTVTSIPSPGLFGNASSKYLEGKNARLALEDARSRCALVLGVKPETLYFTSGGTESNAIVLHSLLLRVSKPGFLYSAVEHPSIQNNAGVLKRLGLKAVSIGAEKDGRISAESLGEAIEKLPALRFAAIMAVNNEVGSVMDMPSLSRVIRSKSGAPIHFHSDLVQAAGKIPLDISLWDLDSASLSAHKLGGPKGIGLLYLKKTLEPLNPGTQERGIRPGTENVPGALSFALCLEKHASAGALKAASEEAEQRMAFFITKLKKIKRCILIPEDRNAEDKRFSPWILQMRFKDMPGEVLVRALDSSGIACSTGSACSSSSPERPVLEAMGLDARARLEGIRISQGWTTSREDFEALAAAIEKALAFL